MFVFVYMDLGRDDGSLDGDIYSVSRSFTGIHTRGGRCLMLGL